MGKVLPKEIFTNLITQPTTQQPSMLQTQAKSLLFLSNSEYYKYPHFKYM